MLVRYLSPKTIPRPENLQSFPANCGTFAMVVLEKLPTCHKIYLPSLTQANTTLVQIQNNGFCPKGMEIVRLKMAEHEVIKKKNTLKTNRNKYSNLRDAYNSVIFDKLLSCIQNN